MSTESLNEGEKPVAQSYFVPTQENNFKNEKELKEKIFQTIVFDKLESSFEEGLCEAELSNEAVSYFRNKMSTLSDDDILGILSFPKVLRLNLFKKKIELNGDGVEAVDEIVKTFLEASRKYGYRLGYHVSLSDIKETPTKWDIVGTEFDDRDEMKMAYYSVDYDHFYRKKSARWVYFVRAETGASSSHKIDNDSRWSRAPSLSIVDRIPLGEVDELVREKMSEFKNMQVQVQEKDEKYLV